MPLLRWNQDREPETKAPAPATPVDFLGAQRFRPRKRRSNNPNTAETLPERLAATCAWLDSD